MSTPRRIRSAKATAKGGGEMSERPTLPKLFATVAEAAVILGVPRTAIYADWEYPARSSA